MTQGLPLTVPDLRCVDDLDPYGAETTSDLETLEQDVLHILVETPGSNIDDPDRGIGIEDLLGGTANITSIAATIDRELAKDDRIDACKTTVTMLSSGQAGASYQLDIEIQVDGAVLPLSFLFGQGGLTVAP